MKYMTGNEIRNLWLDFFRSKGHAVEKGASLIPNDDPTLLWMNAGVAALKKYFDGSVVPKNPRIVNVQKCIRTNDIDHVGKTARHHTFFEMLGNFSIGDYFRTEAVTWGYELLTDPKWFGFDKSRLYVTIYPTDTDTRDLWIRLGIDPAHIVPTIDNNFWEIGVGPCGPCTEIFYDRGDAYGDFNTEDIRLDKENDRFVEIWNIVFSQYNAISGLKREEYPELPSKNIDTGCGLERMACVIQNVPTNFETDLFMPIIKRIEVLSGLDYTGQMSFKVIADHVRTITMAVADGAVLSNEGRGYVLRRLLRRAVKYGRHIGIEKPFMADLVDTVVDIMRGFYPYLSDKIGIIKKIVFQEESKFLETIAQGEKRFEMIAQQTTGKMISGADAFLLYDTFGFPVELTIEYADEIGYTVDTDGFSQEMEKQRERARNARKDIQSMKSQNEEYLEYDNKSEFVGYSTTTVKTRIIKIFPEGIVLEKTPFYATSGGQVADTGIIEGPDFSLQVIDVEKLPNGQFIHHYQSGYGRPEEGAIVLAEVDGARRQLIARHHSATHLMFKAMREVLGRHVSQQGSQVSDKFLRFDFNHYEMPKDEEILLIEKKVRQMIGKSEKTATDIISVDEALGRGAVAEFGEKYGDLVRCVDLHYTIDLCGGTHVSDLSEIGSFAIRAIYSIGSGTYRIEALADGAVKSLPETYANTDIEIEGIEKRIMDIRTLAKEKGFSPVVENLISSLTTPPFVKTGADYLKKDAYPIEQGYVDIIHKREQLAVLQNLIKELDKETNRILQEKNTLDYEPYLKSTRNNAIIADVPGASAEQLKQLADDLSEHLPNGFILLASVVTEGKILFVAKSRNKALHAGQMVKKAAEICGGAGGGRPDFAQAGGKDVHELAKALDEIRRLAA